MEMSVREARAGFAAALSAAERGERVTITKHGRAIAELGPSRAKSKGKWDWDEFDRVQKQLGLPQAALPGGVNVDWDADHAWSRGVLGLSDWEDEQP